MANSYQVLTADEALRRLKDGNRQYLAAEKSEGDISPRKRRDTYEHGQHPFAIVVTCSDSRVIPESIFSAGIGELFVIRIAGNVIDSHQLGSIEYAADHLGCRLLVIMGHTCCGAVSAAIHQDADGYIRYITDEIRAAIGEETDDYRACCLNVRHGMEQVEINLDIQAMEKAGRLKVVGAVYHIESGNVEFL